MQVMLLHLSVCPQGRDLYDVISCLAAWCHVPSRGSLSSGSLPRGLSVKGQSGLCEEGRGLYEKGVS